MASEVEVSDEFIRWYEDLTEDEAERVDAAVTYLEQNGPNAKRPIVGEVAHSNIKNLKELIVPSGNLRILFAFSPRRTAYLILGGDKTGEWNGWYDRLIPEAERLWGEYLEEIESNSSTR